MKSIKVALSGAHSTGKTTYLKGLTNLLRAEGIEFKMISDLAIKCPLPILKNHTVDSSLWIASKGILEEIEAQNTAPVLLVDRPILDCWAYFNAVCRGKYLNQNPKLKTLNGIIDNWLPTYDIILQTVVDENIPIEDNKGRNLDPEYRNLIGGEMIKASKHFGITPIYLTYNNKQEKLKFVFSFIKEKITDLG